MLFIYENKMDNKNFNVFSISYDMFELKYL